MHAACIVAEYHTAEAAQVGLEVLTNLDFEFDAISIVSLHHEIVRLIFFISFAFWIGLLTLSGSLFIAPPFDIPGRFGLPLATSRPLGYVLLTMALACSQVVRRCESPSRYSVLNFNHLLYISRWLKLHCRHWTFCWRLPLYTYCCRLTSLLATGNL